MKKNHSVLLVLIILLNTIAIEAESSYWKDFESVYIYTSVSQDYFSENESYESIAELQIRNISRESNQIEYNIDYIKGVRIINRSCHILIDDSGKMNYELYSYNDLSQRWSSALALSFNLPLNLVELQHHYSLLFFIPLEYPLFDFKTDYAEGDFMLETSFDFNSSIHQGHYIKLNYTETSSITQDNHTKEFRFSDRGELFSYLYNKTTAFIDSEFSYSSETNVTLEKIVLKIEDTNQTGIYRFFYIQFIILVLIAKIIRRRIRNN